MATIKITGIHCIRCELDYAPTAKTLKRLAKKQTIRCPRCKGDPNKPLVRKSVKRPGSGRWATTRRRSKRVAR